jgi:hypothetical protein
MIAVVLLYLGFSAFIYWREFLRVKSYGSHRLTWKEHLGVAALQVALALGYIPLMIFLRIEAWWWVHVTLPRRDRA